ncbi:FAD-binding oxidoreductase [Bradyrhizobium sp. 24]|nr:FAD-binding oxidoreductase [Bradyrhizobium sp. 37]MCK1382386.1 FAD-binding oxidoreductase [Bradyrhizobium sp. 24]MCK1771448.1 FAD-binding oxidoreductase [Bradyrhizobium sp. 134]
MSIECAKAIDQWMDHRPSTPDGLPCIDTPRSCGGLFYGFGHGHSGVTQAAATAKPLAALVVGQQPHFDISAMAAHRF